MIQLLLSLCMGLAVAQADEVASRRYYEELKKNRKASAFDRKSLYKNTVGEGRRADFEAAKRRDAAARSKLNARLATQAALDAAKPLTPEEKAEIEKLAREEKLNPTKEEAGMGEAPSTGRSRSATSFSPASPSGSDDVRSGSGSSKGPAESGTVKEVIEFSPQPIRRPVPKK